jgi:hypothetical protein
MRVGYNLQIAVDTRHHLIVAHEVTNVGTDRHQLANMAGQASGGSYAKAQPRERGAGTDAEGRFSSPVFRPLSTSVLAAFAAPVLRAVNCWPRAAAA